MKLRHLQEITCIIIILSKLYQCQKDKYMFSVIYCSFICSNICPVFGRSCCIREGGFIIFNSLRDHFTSNTLPVHFYNTLNQQHIIFERLSLPQNAYTKRTTCFCFSKHYLFLSFNLKSALIPTPFICINTDSIKYHSCYNFNNTSLF